MLPIAVLEVVRRPEVSGAVALLEDGGECVGARAFYLRLVGLDPDLLVVRGKGTHAPRLRFRRLRVMPNGM